MTEQSTTLNPADLRTTNAQLRVRVREGEEITQRLREELDARASAELARAYRITTLIEQVVAAEDERDMARARTAELGRQLSDLLALVGAETPIAAFDLATSWRAERAGLWEELDEIRASAQSVIDRAARDDNNMTPDTAAALRELEWRVRDTPRVSSPAPAQSEETREYATVVRLGACPRCGKLLRAPGISVASGGVLICTPCLRPGEVEVARARSL